MSPKRFPAGLWVLVSAGLFAAPLCWAYDKPGEDHGHEGLHGGYFGDAENVYHYELVLKRSGPSRFYLYDGYAKPIIDVSGIAARWTLDPDSSQPSKGSFEPSPDKTHYLLMLPESQGPVVHIVVEAEKDGRWHPVEFQLPLDEALPVQTQ